MNPDSFPAPVAALDHPVMDKMMQELAAMRYPDRHTPVPPTYTSVVTTVRYNDEYHRNWFVARQIAKTHFGDSQLQDPLEEILEPPSGRASVTPAQRAAAAKIQEWYLEGSQDVMMRFYNLGLSRVSTAAHLYALDFSLWMRGYALPRGDFGNSKFYYTKPSAHVGPFSSEYDNFFAERFRERHMASRMVTPSDMPPQSAPSGPQHVTVTSTNIDPLVREETERANLEIPAIQALPTSTAQARRDSNKLSLDAAIPSTEIDQPSRRLREETKPAPPMTPVTEAHLTSTAKPSSGLNTPNITSADIDQPPRRETRPAPPATSAAEAHSTSIAKPSRDNKPNLTSADIDQPPRRETRPASPATFATEAHSTSIAKSSSGSNTPNLTSADINQPPRRETRPAPPATSAIEAHSTSTAKPSRDNKPNLMSADIDQPLRGGTKPGPPETFVTRAHPSSAAQPSRVSNKRGLDAADTMALAPQPKRAQPGLPLRTLTSMGLLGRNDPTPTIATQTSYQSYRPETSVQGSRGRPRPTARLCGNGGCRSPDHELADCFGPPSLSGDIDGCPFCNTQLHVLDTCPGLPRVSRDELFDVLITRRANLPPIRTAMSILSLAAEFGKSEVLAETMPLLKRTVKEAYSQMRLWQRPNPSRLFRDPSLPSDLEELMDKLYDISSWNIILEGTTRNDNSVRSIQTTLQGLTVFREKWIGELVPYRKTYQEAGIYVQGRGQYPFGRVRNLQYVQKRHREKVHRRLLDVLRERALTQQRQN